MSRCNPCKDGVAVTPIEFELMIKTTQAKGYGKTAETYTKVFSGYATVNKVGYYDNYNGGSNTVSRSSTDYILETDFDDRITTDHFIKIAGVYYTINSVTDPTINRNKYLIEIHRESAQENV